MTDGQPTGHHEIVVQHGIAGLLGAKGDFHPITTDMGVDVRGSAATGLTLHPSATIHGIRPFDAVPSTSEILPQPPAGLSLVEIADWLQQLKLCQRCIEHGTGDDE